VSKASSLLFPTLSLILSAAARSVQTATEKRRGGKRIEGAYKIMPVAAVESYECTLLHAFHFLGGLEKELLIQARLCLLRCKLANLSSWSPISSCLEHPRAVHLQRSPRLCSLCAPIRVCPNSQEREKGRGDEEMRDMQADQEVRDSKGRLLTGYFLAWIAKGLVRFHFC